MIQNRKLAAAASDDTDSPVDRKSAILVAALAVFTEKGIETATIDDIRRRSEASVGSIYHHFGTKEGIAAALFVDCLNDYWGRLIAALARELDAKRAMHALLETHLDWIVAKPDLARFLFSRRQAVSAAHEQIVRQRTAEHLKLLFNHFKPWLKDGTLRRLPFELYVAILMGPAQELSRHWLGGRISIDPRSAIDELSRAAWHSLATKSERSRPMTRTRISLKAHDGFALTAYRHEPGEPARANMVMAPAMAVPQSYYADFAAYLATQGFRVWTFDYRDTAESAKGSMSKSRADISTWIASDYDAVVQHAGDADRDLPLFVVGHSLGGQVAPLLPSVRRIAGLINIAVGSGSVRHNQPKLQRSSRLLWYFLVPLLCPLFGYFPGKRIGVIGDLPAAVMVQWRRWCMTPEYILSGEPAARGAYARAAYPVLGLTFSDDELLLPDGSRMLHAAYTGAQVDYREIGPQQFGLKRIGHFGFFKSTQEKALWPLVTEWLNQRSGGFNGAT